MMADYHTHTCRCGHARGQAREYLEQARQKGLREIGFSDHIPMYWLPPEQRNPGLAMAEADFPGYLAEVLELAAESPCPEVRLGVEVDYIPGYEAEAARMLAGHPFDYVIGSVHFIGRWAFDSPHELEEYGRRDIDEVYRQYFDLISRAAQSGLFDIIAHPDLVKKFGYRSRTDPAVFYRQAARAMAAGGPPL